LVPFPVVGGRLRRTHGRIDFDLADAPEDRRTQIEDALLSYIGQIYRESPIIGSPEELQGRS